MHPVTVNIIFKNKFYKDSNRLASEKIKNLNSEFECFDRKIDKYKNRGQKHATHRLGK